jgi:hypothetical protein
MRCCLGSVNSAGGGCVLGLGGVGGAVVEEVVTPAGVKRWHMGWQSLLRPFGGGVKCRQVTQLRAPVAHITVTRSECVMATPGLGLFVGLVAVAVRVLLVLHPAQAGSLSGLL